MSSDNNNNNNMDAVIGQEPPKEEQPSSFSQKWANALQKLRRPIQSGVCQLALVSARNPWTTLTLTSVLTVILAVTGILTNITFESKDDVIFTPFGSAMPEYIKWVNTESDFPPTLRDINVLLHSQGANVMESCIDSVNKAFDVWEALEGLDNFPAACETEATNTSSCPWSSVTQFFNNSRAVWEEEVTRSGLGTNEECLETLSAPFFPNGDFVLGTKVFGNPVFDPVTSLLISASSTFHILGLPLAEDVREAVERVEADAVDVLLRVEDQWRNDGGMSPATTTILEQFNESSFSAEFENGFVENIPFLAVAFTLMTLFTAGVFFKRDSVESCMAVGLGASATVILGMGAAFGLMFICGIPMTSIHGILPFILVGIGLDDAFIITNEFYRLRRNLFSVEEQISKTMHIVGLLVATTTVTSAVAFGLGCISSIPAVYWLCLYALTAIVVDFFFCVTMFIAIIVIDEQRVENKRRNLLCCLSVKSQEDENKEEDQIMEAAHPPESFVDRSMAKYADLLFKPAAKVVVLVVFTALFAVCAWSTTMLKQEFTVELVLPQGSYVVNFLNSALEYTGNGGFEGTLVFHDIDQSTLEGHQAMEKYLNDMVALKQISSPPENFWLRNFQIFLQNNSTAAADLFSFEELISAFLELPAYHALYNDNIARDDQGQVTASRVKVKYDQVDPDDIKGQINTLENQERVAHQQPVNQGGVDAKDWAFFSFDNEYFIWEFFKACPEELILTTIMGVVAVTLISLVAIPHWSAVFFASPLIMVLYVDLLGILQFAGITINSVSYIKLTVSIGLMVDFLIHILLRYFESAESTRQEKVKDTLKTMGASVAIGGFTTFLGVLPLAFNTTGIFEVVFVTFIALVLLGVSHGLILLPVLLSICGPEETILLLLKEEVVSSEKAMTKREDTGDFSN